MDEKNNLLRPIWKKIFKSALILSIILFILLSYPRIYGLLGPGDVEMLILVNFLLMWILPFIFFSKYGLKKIGIRKPNKKIWLLYSFLLGLLLSFICFLIGILLFDMTIDNWYINISKQILPEDFSSEYITASIVLIITIPGILFSSVGEELFFRGIIHESIKEKKNKNIAIIGNALAFAGIHIFHHGINRIGSNWYFLFLSGSIFFLLMLGLSWILSILKERSESILPSIICHLSFNLMMFITIFLFLIE